MTNRQIKFVNEYLLSGNATQAAIKAGYSEKTAYSMGNALLKNLEVKKALDDRMEAMQSEKIASAEEVLQYLTSVIRGESKAEIVVTEFIGDGMSEARHIEKLPDEKERLKAAELLAKRYGMLTDKMAVSGQLPVIISGGDSLED